MKRIFYAGPILISLFLLNFSLEASPQSIFKGDTLRRERTKERQKTVLTARYTDKVDKTNDYDQTLLMYASSRGFMQSCRILIRRGASIDRQALNGVNALMCASGNDQPKTAGLLLKKGSN